jgi:zinc protease
MEDLNAATVADVAAFFKTYYAPNNAVLVLVGDFKTNEVLAKIEKYFGGIPSQAPPPAVDMTEPEQTAERRKTIEDPLAQLTRLDIIYKVPPGNTPESYALAVAGDIMSGGQSSRLYQELVKEKEVVTSISAGPDERRGPSLFVIDALIRPGQDVAEVEKMIYAAIERLKNEPVTDLELEKVRMQVRVNEIERLSSTLSRATRLGQLAVFFNDPNLINTYGKKLSSVSKQQIQQAARTFLTESNRTVIVTIPKPAARPEGQ